MNKLEKILSRWNFRKIVKWYIIWAIAAAAVCIALICGIYTERIKFAWQYAKLMDAAEDVAKGKAEASVLEEATDSTAAASSDVMDILITDGNGKVLYSAKKSEFANDTFTPVMIGADKDYLGDPSCRDAAFLYVKNSEFMLNSIINTDFGKISEDYNDESSFDEELSGRTIYMLSRVREGSSGLTVYAINRPTSVPGGMTALKFAAAIAMMFFCIYWVLVALWMYRDAAASGLSAIGWGLIGLFTNLVGLIVYEIYRHSLSVCPSCGTAQDPSNLYCCHCGTQLGKRCPKCGSRIGAKDLFCPHCGTRIVPTTKSFTER